MFIIVHVAKLISFRIVGTVINNLKMFDMGEKKKAHEKSYKEKLSNGD